MEEFITSGNWRGKHNSLSVVCRSPSGNIGAPLGLRMLSQLLVAPTLRTPFAPVSGPLPLRSTHFSHNSPPSLTIALSSSVTTFRCGPGLFCSNPSSRWGLAHPDVTRAFFSAVP